MILLDKKHIFTLDRNFYSTNTVHFFFAHWCPFKIQKLIYFNFDPLDSSFPMELTVWILQSATCEELVD